MHAFITGAANGIGRAAAERLLDDGHQVTAYDIDTAGLADLPDGITTYEGDVRDADRVAEAVDQETFDVLINDAGHQELGAVEDMTVDEARDHFETNVLGMWRVTREALPLLREREGRIVNVSSLAGEIAGPFWAAYAASKHAVEGFSDALRREVEPFGVDVVIVQPGPVRTGFNEQGREHLRTYLPGSPYADRYHRMLDPALGGTTPERAARTVARAATASRPRTRYRVTWQARLAPKLAAILPTWLVDRIVRRVVE